MTQLIAKSEFLVFGWFSVKQVTQFLTWNEKFNKALFFLNNCFSLMSWLPKFISAKLWREAFFKVKFTFWLICCIFWPAFGCCACQRLVQIVIFSIFCAKNLKKQEICSIFLGVKQSTSVLVQMQKTCYLLKFAANFLLFQGFLHKKCWKCLLQPAFGVHSTQTLVEIYNIDWFNLRNCLGL